MCNVIEGDRTYSGQIKGLIAKLTNLKYDMLMACLDRDIQISRYKRLKHSNEINMKIFHIRFLRNHWVLNRKLPESCRKLPIASGRDGARIKSKRGQRPFHSDLYQGFMLLFNSVQPFVEGTEPLYDFIQAPPLPEAIGNFLQDSGSFRFKNQ